ncbi:9946_t:CDS:1 [Acaulospora colombiana]|uniref:9946_t:CDS:1 n=1 Tax=Acaulospora colombiana TaxID=27376 RepID=A0ACA9LW01_9GLOM|nr:9946_t:CDS:1 [Acaulospora colombiana]
MVSGFNVPFPTRCPSTLNEATSTPFQPDLSIKLICPECKNPDPKIIEEYASGDMVCGECGLVLGGRIIDTRSEWRTFSTEENDKDPSRIGAVSDPTDASALDTMISWKGNTDNSPLSRAHFKATINKGNVGVKYALQEIETIGHAMDLSPELIETSKQLYKRSVEEKVLRGKNKLVIYAACIYIACRTMNVGRTLKEIIAVTRVPKGHLSRAVRILVSTFDLNLKQMTSEDLMARFCNRLNIPHDVTGICIKVSQRVEQLGLLTGRTQNTVAAAVILFVTSVLKCDVLTDKIALISGMATPSIKGVCRIIEAEKDKFQDLLGKKVSDVSSNVEIDE